MRFEEEFSFIWSHVNNPMKRKVKLHFSYTLFLFYPNLQNSCQLYFLINYTTVHQIEKFKYHQTTKKILTSQVIFRFAASDPVIYTDVFIYRWCYYTSFQVWLLYFLSLFLFFHHFPSCYPQWCSECHWVRELKQKSMDLFTFACVWDPTLKSQIFFRSHKFSGNLNFGHLLLSVLFSSIVQWQF